MLCFDAKSNGMCEETEERSAVVLCRTDAIDVDQIIGHDNAQDAHAFLDMIDWDTVKIELPPTANIPAQHNSAAFAGERTGVVNCHPNIQHGPFISLHHLVNTR